MTRTLFIGRWCPFHNGHKTIIDSFVKNGKPVCIAIRDTKEKYPVWLRMLMIREVYKEEFYNDMVKIIVIPDIDQVAVGRKVGYYTPGRSRSYSAAAPLLWHDSRQDAAARRGRNQHLYEQVPRSVRPHPRPQHHHLYRHPGTVHYARQETRRRHRQAEEAEADRRMARPTRTGCSRQEDP